MKTDHMLFVTANKECSLQQIANRVFDALNLLENEERDSSNYPNGHYFVGYAENVTVEVYDDDIGRKEGFPFQVSVGAATWRRGKSPISDDQASIVASLTNAGIDVFVPNGKWFLNAWDGNGYTFRATQNRRAG